MERSTSRRVRWKDATVLLLLVLLQSSSSRAQPWKDHVHHAEDLSKRHVSLRHLRQVEDTVVNASRHIVDEPSARIMGGSAASKSHPYFVLWGGCGATLIHNDIALTAAHCSRRQEAQVGPTDRSKSSNQWTRVSRMNTHPDYNDETLDYDLAVLKLEGWFQTKLVRLNTQDGTPGDGESLRILGFGGQSETLNEGIVQSITPNRCRSLWGLAGYSIDESAILCSTSENGINPCSGDSGGPLLTSSNVQVGVISSGDCDGRLPSVYTRVSVAHDWIQDQICELSDYPPERCRGSFDGMVAGAETVRVDIHLDDYPQDIRWAIMVHNNEGTQEIASGGDFELANSIESRFVFLPSGSIYSFEIKDVGGFADGLGSRGSYNVAIVDKDGNDKEVLVSGNGNFGQSERIQFAIGNVPSTPSPSITRPPENDSSSLESFPPPTAQPSPSPSARPTNLPTRRTSSPTATPTPEPSGQPSPGFTTANPSGTPSFNPTRTPTQNPTWEATSSPTVSPTTSSPTISPTSNPTVSPTLNPTTLSTSTPTISPTLAPTGTPTAEPSTPNPTGTPTIVSTSTPTKEPTNEPTMVQTDEPTIHPTTSSPTIAPTAEATARLTPVPAPSSVFEFVPAAKGTKDGDVFVYLDGFA